MCKCAKGEKEVLQKKKVLSSVHCTVCKCTQGEKEVLQQKKVSSSVHCTVCKCAQGEKEVLQKKKCPAVCIAQCASVHKVKRRRQQETLFGQPVAGEICQTLQLYENG